MKATDDDAIRSLTREYERLSGLRLWELPPTTGSYLRSRPRRRGLYVRLRGWLLRPRVERVLVVLALVAMTAAPLAMAVRVWLGR